MDNGVFFQAYGKDRCCLCGAEAKLTGEHKVKASCLRREFGNTEMVVSRYNNPILTDRIAQGPNSRHLKFASPICEACNTSRTQKADKEFDQFNSFARDILVEGGNPANVFEKLQYREGSDSYLNVFRYFAKLLCCHLAEIQAPRPRRLSEFAISRSDGNCIWLTVQRDLTFIDMSQLFDKPLYASHGGLLIYGSKSTGVSDRFYSTLSIGPVQYVFFYELAGIEKLELALHFKDFTVLMKGKAIEAEGNPIQDSDWRRLGFRL